MYLLNMNRLYCCFLSNRILDSSSPKIFHICGAHMQCNSCSFMQYFTYLVNSNNIATILCAFEGSIVRKSIWMLMMVLAVTFIARKIIALHMPQMKCIYPFRSCSCGIYGFFIIRLINAARKPTVIKNNVSKLNHDI